jgi:hypothetical protein
MKTERPCDNSAVRHVSALPVFLCVIVTVSVLEVSAYSSAASSKNAIILSGDSVGSVYFGESQSTAAASLETLIGQSVGGVRDENDGDCIISAGLYWSNFAAFFYHGKFDGYQTGNSLSGKSEPAFNGVTSRGLRVGFTLARAKKLYGSAFSTNGEQNGVYAVATKTGTIRGYLSSEPTQVPPTKIRILTIGAGSVGCPAMSPG